MITQELTAAFRRLSQRLSSRKEDEDSIDALHDAFCRLWTKRDSLANQGKADGLLSVTARNLRIDKLRRDQRFERIDDGAQLNIPQEEDDSYSKDLYEEINRIISKVLTPRDREIFILRDRDGWEFNELSVKFGLSESNIRMIISRARKTVRTFYLNNK